MLSHWVNFVYNERFFPSGNMHKYLIANDKFQKLIEQD